MARNADVFEGKCSLCGAVKIDKIWRNSVFITDIPEVKNKLPEIICPECSRERQSQHGHLMFALD